MLRIAHTLLAHASKAFEPDTFERSFASGSQVDFHAFHEPASSVRHAIDGESRRRPSWQTPLKADSRHEAALYQLRVDVRETGKQVEVPVLVVVS
jgi:hypothetical protein